MWMIWTDNRINEGKRQKPKSNRKKKKTVRNNRIQFKSERQRRKRKKNSMKTSILKWNRKKTRCKWAFEWNWNWLHKSPLIFVRQDSTLDSHRFWFYLPRNIFDLFIPSDSMQYNTNVIFNWLHFDRNQMKRKWKLRWRRQSDNGNSTFVLRRWK